ncbi:hypothetical protein ACFQ5J_11495 [Lacticaseibacillus baoqingensis]|uniref:Uncharacterized protein n=1 Tax=Lacticaseibacillus baoqingensis TaxID=2486013 RepID=A0ABW4EBN5_9LACO|nr:hypothetical protein [Lacticaseibacillus baoqingensis]
MFDPKLQHQSYANAPVQSAAFYADPEDMLANHKKLRETLEAFVKTQSPDTPFALQILATHSAITLMPLGLFDLDEVKQWEHTQREQAEVTTNTQDGLPLVLQFESHVKEADNRKIILDLTANTLFTDFNHAFKDRLWPRVVELLTTNQKLLYQLAKQLTKQKETAAAKQLQALQKLSDDQLKAQVGFALPPSEQAHYADYTADLAQVNAILLASADFVREQPQQGISFQEMMMRPELRNVFFWCLDNTFYEIVYFYIQAYGGRNAKLSKHLRSMRKQLAPMMRTDAWQKADEALKAKKTVVLPEFFGAVFFPIAEQLEVAINQFAPEG